MIPNTEYGFIAKTGDVDSIVNELRKAVNKDPKELSAMATREKKYVADHFSVKKQLASIEKVYKQVTK